MIGGKYIYLSCDFTIKYEWIDFRINQNMNDESGLENLAGFLYINGYAKNPVPLTNIYIDYIHYRS